MLNANIPLNNTSPARQYPWRVGVFLGIFLLSFFFGWTVAEHTFTGIRIPQLTTPSGISLRITPENALWLNKHTAGLSINTSCPLDLPTLISFKRAPWILLGDTGTEQRTFFTGNVPPKLTNYEIAFSCEIVTTEKGFFLGDEAPLSFSIPFTTPSGWLWINNTNYPVKLIDHGITLNIQTAQNNGPLPIPQENLTSALPIIPIHPPNPSVPTRNSLTPFNPFSQQWQGLSDLFTTNKGIALFSWEKENNLAFGLLLNDELSDEEIIALTYDLGNIPINEQKNQRKDEVSYTIETRDQLHLVSIDSIQKEVRLPDETPVGFIQQQDGYTLFSTAATTWELNSPQWKAVLSSKRGAIKHTPQTLASFGKKIFTTKRNINILDE